MEQCILPAVFKLPIRRNGNGRKYPEKVLKREIDRYMQVVKDNRATGELDHPDDSVINLKKCFSHGNRLLVGWKRCNGKNQGS
jgi:hypothetical protein